MRRHLFWRIYVTLLACLALLAVLGAGLWRIGDDRAESGIEIGRRVLGALLPTVDSPSAEQQAAIDRLARALDADLLMIAPDGRRFTAGAPIADRRGWVMTLADGRRITAQLPHARWRPIWMAGAFLLGLGLIVGIAAHPIVRRLTRPRTTPCTWSIVSAICGSLPRSPGSGLGSGGS